MELELVVVVVIVSEFEFEAELEGEFEGSEVLGVDIDDWDLNVDMDGDGMDAKHFKCTGIGALSYSAWDMHRRPDLNSALILAWLESSAGVNARSRGMMRGGRRRDKMWSWISVGRRGKGWNVCSGEEVASEEVGGSVSFEAETRSWDEVAEVGRSSGSVYWDDMMTMLMTGSGYASE